MSSGSGTANRHHRSCSLLKFLTSFDRPRSNGNPPLRSQLLPTGQHNVKTQTLPNQYAVGYRGLRLVESAGRT
jgi:hypothetical protein